MDVPQLPTIHAWLDRGLENPVVASGALPRSPTINHSRSTNRPTVPPGLWCTTPLPVPTKIDARFVLHDERHDAVDLGAVRVFPVILAPSRFLREANQVRTGKRDGDG